MQELSAPIAPSSGETFRLMVDLIALSGVAANRATRLFRYRVVAHLATLAIGLVATLSETPAFGYVCAVVAAISEFIAYTYRRKASDLQDLSEMARRHGMLSDAFGGPIEYIDATDIVAQSDVNVLDKELETRSANYYASKKEVGFDRLCDHLQETAFWSKHLYAEAARRSLNFFFWFSAITLVLAFLAPLLTWDKPLYVPRSLVLIIAFIASVDWLGDYLAFSAARTQAEAVDRRVFHLPPTLSPRNPKSLASLLSIFGDYVVARASAPLIPSSIYLKSRDRLNKLWDERASHAGEPARR